LIEDRSCRKTAVYVDNFSQDFAYLWVRVPPHPPILKGQVVLSKISFMKTIHLRTKLIVLILISLGVIFTIDFVSPNSAYMLLPAMIMFFAAGVVFGIAFTVELDLLDEEMKIKKETPHVE